MWRSSRIYFRSTLVANDSLLYADDGRIVFQHKSIIEIEKQLMRDFSSLRDWFVDNKLSIHFGQDKAKSILFGTKHKLRNAESLNIVYNGTEITQHANVKYLDCILGESLSDKLMALNISHKVNSHLKFLHRHPPPFRRLLCNALTQPLFDYACRAWFPNLSKKQRLRLQGTQNKCMRFCLQLNKMSRICTKEFLELIWLNVHDRYLQFIGPDVFKFHNNQCPDYFHDVFCSVDDNGLATRSSVKNLKLPFRKSKLGKQSLSYVGTSTKTELIIFRYPWKHLPREPYIRTNNYKLKLHSHIKYLGILIDEVLSWNKQIDDICTKLARANGIISKLRHFVPKKTCVSVYFSLFYSHILYGCLVWSYSTQRNIDRIIKLQKRCIGIIMVLFFLN